MIAETILEIQRLLDEHPAVEQAQARAFVDARYPAPVHEPVHRVKNGVNAPVQTRFKTGANDPTDPVQNQVHAPGAEPGSEPVHEQCSWSSSFLVFWSVYPRKVGKLEALRSWNRIKLPKNQELLDRILQSVREQKNSETWTKDNGQFIPLPKTWLNQGRWDDEPTQVHRGAFLSERTRGNADVARSFVEHMNP